jgi:hypothetical protein
MGSVNDPQSIDVGSIVILGQPNAELVLPHLFALAFLSRL